MYCSAPPFDRQQLWEAARRASRRLIPFGHRSPRRGPTVHARPVRYTLLDEGFHLCPTGTQRDVSLRVGPQVQTLLPPEGRSRGGCRTGQNRSDSTGASRRGRPPGGAHTATQAADTAALEGDRQPWLLQARPHATEGRRRLSAAGEAARSFRQRTRRSGAYRSRLSNSANPSASVNGESYHGVATAALPAPGESAAPRTKSIWPPNPQRYRRSVPTTKLVTIRPDGRACDGS
jgi:hypothetical protein